MTVVHFLPVGRRPVTFDRIVAAEVVAGKRVKIVRSHRR